MKTKIIEATNGPQNWGKFLVGEFDSEWEVSSMVSLGRSLLRSRGHHEQERLVLDLETGEGAIFSLGGMASADLAKHKIWVCPLFEPFLTWLYDQPVDLNLLPAHIDLPDAPFSVDGYRRKGAGR
jgi:hypothetical protein